MKHTFTGMMFALALILSLILGMAALAENAGAEAPELPAAGDIQPAEEPADAATDDAALQEAFKAYQAAKSSSREEALEAELKGYVEAGKLTQEQADLILNWYKERDALRNGACPSCGYQFRNGNGFGGKGGRMNGMNGMGNMGGRGGRMNGMNGRQPGMEQNGMNGQQPSQSQSSGSADGMAFGFGAQTLPALDNADDMI